jgi:hypothetical protein
MDSLDKALIEMIPQGSEKWHDVRLGRFTSSQVYCLMKDPKSKADKEAGKFSDKGRTYIMEKIAEKLTGVRIEFTSKATEWGHEQEPVAKEWITRKWGIEIQEAGFTPYEDHAGGSPDGLIEDGILEIKSPYNTANHLEHCLIDCPEYFKAEFPEYYFQCQANMLFTGKEKCLFVSFDPRVQDDCGLFRFTLPINHEDVALIDARLRRATIVMAGMYDKITNR